ncbi:hypothetical protein M440DRAFT_129282 [Trichoderma longibrachiatum ATCC 18648]|uniref:Uncharacterized protein n=1 Tax=Trichoderma longibrachiatum ATCC 18648 TaxID=983965 RepID=A0A2T4BVJ9_TRILO|nr:hypothetical protein M440DRAFT_129282 [Trichoderma longibrachiatum ATCC 18648]
MSCLCVSFVCAILYQRPSSNDLITTLTPFCRLDKPKIKMASFQKMRHKQPVGVSPDMTSGAGYDLSLVLIMASWAT